MLRLTKLLLPLLEGMVTLGYAVLGESHRPQEMVENVVDAEERGIEYAMLSDHFHPWTTTQGESPFVWGVLGGVAHTTDEITVGTGVTAPTIRIHPAIIAQAAATAATQFNGRFVFGIGTGENLNEHILGDRWPPHDVRLAMLKEAMEIIRLLWEGGTKTYRGEYYTVEQARVFTLPDVLPLVPVAAGGERAAAAAGHYGDGIISTSPDPAVIERFEQATEADYSPHYGQLHCCFGPDATTAAKRAYDRWPNTGIPGELTQELPSPAHIEQAAKLLDPADIADRVVCGPEPNIYIEKIQEFADAGYDHVHLHQIGDNQTAFLEFFENEISPSF